MCVYVCEVCIVEAGNLEIRLARSWWVFWGCGLGFVCVLQLWEDDLRALWACPMDKCEYYKNCPSPQYQELESRHSYRARAMALSFSGSDQSEGHSFLHSKTKKRAYRDSSITKKTQSLSPPQPQKARKTLAKQSLTLSKCELLKHSL